MRRVLGTLLALLAISVPYGLAGVAAANRAGARVSVVTLPTADAPGGVVADPAAASAAGAPDAEASATSTPDPPTPDAAAPAPPAVPDPTSTPLVLASPLPLVVIRPRSAHPLVGPPRPTVTHTPSPTPRPTPTAAPPAPRPTPTPAPISSTNPPTSSPYTTAQIRQIITGAANRHGVDPTRLISVAQCESGLDPNAYNPAGPYDGLFQFWPPTFQAHGGTNIWDPYQQSDIAASMFAAGQGGAWGCA